MHRRLRQAVAAVESRGSATSDLPPLAPGAHEAAAAGLRLLGVRPRSRSELRSRLLDKELAEPDVEEALSRLEDWGLLDDRDFAEEWVRGRRRRRGKAGGALRRELESKGVAVEHIDAALADLDPDSEREHAVELVRARLERLGGPPEEERGRQALTRRLVGFLQRRGYPQGMSMAVVRDELTR